MLQGLILSSIVFFSPLLRVFGQEPGKLSRCFFLLSRKVLRYSQWYLCSCSDRKTGGQDEDNPQEKKKKKKKDTARPPRPPVHWFPRDNSRSVMSTICLSAPEHACQLVSLHTLCVCVLRHNTAAASLWLWAIKRIIWAFTLGITGRCWEIVLYPIVAHMPRLEQR